MNGLPQQNTNGAAHQQRHSLDTTNNSGRAGGAMPMPVPSGAYPGEEGGQMRVPGTLPRSPPKNKNTAHVPCKFFMQGQCQAGRTCPFSHDPESAMRPTPCKYFAKGACKFGRKCALLHITPDGNVTNRNGGPYMASSHSAATFSPGISGQQMGNMYSAAAPPGLLAQGLEQRPAVDAQDEYGQYPRGSRNGYDAPQFDMIYTSASPQYGSPTHNDRFASSPPGHGLSAASPPSQQGFTMADAKFPSSFDSNGVSMAARNALHPASVPVRFPLESPPSSLPRKSQLGNTALRDLHSSAYGDNRLDGMLAGLGSSPPTADEPLSFPKRPLYGNRLRVSQPFVSASVGTKLPSESFDYSDEEDADTDREEELIPASLRDLIPEGRSRRASRPRVDHDEATPATFLASQRRTVSGHASSPHYSSSPSRYSGTFARMTSNRESGETSNFPAIGSPLRNEGLSSGMFQPSSLTGRSPGGEISPGLSSPPKQASMSMLTQELQRTKLDAARAASGSHPTIPSRTSSYANAVNSGSSVPATGRRSIDRVMSNGSVGTPKIEEEEVFSFDDAMGEGGK